MANLTDNSFSFASGQAVIFTPDNELSSSRLMKELVPSWMDFYEATPFVLPIRDGVPASVPRIVLQDEDEEWRYELSADRAVVRWNTSGSGGEITPNEFFRTAAKHLQEYAEHEGVRVARLGAVVVRHAETTEPADELSQRFCSSAALDGPLKDLSSFEIHARHMHESSFGIAANLWTRCRTGQLSQDSQLQRVVVVEQDFNTVAEDLATRSIPIESVNRFFDSSPSILHEKLQSFFGE